MAEPAAVMRHNGPAQVATPVRTDKFDVGGALDVIRHFDHLVESQASVDVGLNGRALEGSVGGP